MKRKQQIIAILARLANVSMYGLILFSLIISTLGLIDGMSPVTWLVNALILICFAISFWKYPFSASRRNEAQ